MIHILNKDETLLAILTNGPPGAVPYWDDEMTEKIENAAMMFKFSFFGTAESAQYTEKGNYVIAKDKDGVLQLFVIFDTDEVKKEGKIVKTVYCEHAFFDDLNKDFIRPATLNGVTLEVAGEYVLQGSRCQLGYVEYDGIQSFEWKNYPSLLKALHEIRTAFGCDLIFRVEFNGSRIVGRYVDMVQKRGNDNGIVLTHQTDMLGMRRYTVSGEVKTAMIGVGKADNNGNRVTFTNVYWSVANGNPVDKPVGQDWVGDEEAYQRWVKKDDKHYFGVFEDSQIENPVELLQKSWDDLQTKKDPKYAYEVESAATENIPGFEHRKVRIGDTIYIKDMDFNPPLLLQARAIEVYRHKDLTRDKIIYGNYIPVTIDQNEIISQLKTQIAQKISVTEALEVTYSKTEVDSKDTSVKQEAISTSSTDATNKANTAESNAKSYADIAITSLSDPTFEHGLMFYSGSSVGKTVDQITGVSIVPAVGQSGGSVMEITGSKWVYYRYAIPVDTSRTYRIRFRVRQTQDPTTGGSNVYAGVNTLDANYAVLTGGSAGTARYCAAIAHAINAAEGWQYFEGTITGIGNAETNFRTGTVYVRPMFIVNYSGGNGKTQVDLISFEDITTETNAITTAAADASTKAAGAQTAAQNYADSTYGGTKYTVESWKYTGKTTMDGGKIEADTVTAVQVAARTLTAQEMAIGDFTNLSGLDENNPGSSTIITHTDSFQYFKVGPATYAKINLSVSEKLEYKVGDKYYISFYGWKDAAATVSILARVYCTDATYYTSGQTTLTVGAASGFVEGIVSITQTIPAGKTLDRVEFFLQKNNESTAYFYVRNIELRKMYGGKLLVDGSIETRHIIADGLIGATIKTNATANRGVIIDSTGLKQYDNAGNLLVDMTNGNAIFKGRVQSSEFESEIINAGTRINLGQYGVDAVRSIYFNETSNITFGLSGFNFHGMDFNAEVFNFNGASDFILANGILTAPYQPFTRSYINANFSLPTSGTWYVMPAAVETVDRGSDYNTGTYQFTVPRDGLYAIGAGLVATIALNAGNNTISLAVFKGGAFFSKIAYGSTYNTDYLQTAGTILVYCNEGEVLDVRVTLSIAGNMSNTASNAGNNFVTFALLS